MNTKTVLLAGSTGYIGKNVAKQLLLLGYNVICLVRSKTVSVPKSIKTFEVDITNSKKMNDFNKKCPEFHVIISCIGSKNGGVKDAWDVEYEANKNLLKLGVSKSINQFILLSAICVQRPKCEFQFAKLAFEKALMASKINYTIVRPTAFFKSLSGQVKKVKAGKNFIYFDDGNTTACKPISEVDLAHYICECIDFKARLNKILPIGGRGPAITPIQMGNMLFKLINKTPKFLSIPSKVFLIGEKTIAPFAFFSNKLKNTQQFLKIANYYATESMLVYDQKTQLYDEMLTPEHGNETLESHYKNLLLSKSIDDELGDHKLF